MGYLPFFSLVIFLILLSPAALAQSAPALFFSDLTSGPKTGWEGSSTRGAAVSIWGLNFGASRGSSYVTVNGAQLTSDSDYAEWGVTGTANGIPRGLERITFWIPSVAQDGGGSITITVNGVTSNALPFTVRSGRIFFISVTDGNNAYNGNYSTRTGHTGSDGPWRDLKMGLTHSNPAVRPGDIIYVRGGTYTTLDQDGAFMRARADYGTEGMPIGIIAYPAEIPVADQATANNERGFFSIESGTYDGSYAPDLGHYADYFTFSKFKIIGSYSQNRGAIGIGTIGVGYRIIGNWFEDNCQDAWAGIVDTTSGAQYSYIYGNYFKRNGYDGYKHDIYLKSQRGGIQSHDIYIAWNEFDHSTAEWDSSPRGGIIDVDTSSDSDVGNTQFIYIHDNYFHDSDNQALYLNSNIFNIYVYNNIFANGNCLLGAILLWDPSDSWLFYNNVFYHGSAPSSNTVEILNGGVNHAPGAIFKNNIFYVYSGQNYAHVETPYRFNSDYDMFFGNGVPSGSNYNITHSIVFDPRFVSTTDFHLQSSSPAVDSGTYSVSSIVSRDYDNNARPQGSGYDIGAYEYASQGACQDSDSDGYNSTSCGGTDCNDSNPQVNPGRAEIPYNGLDDDCNSLTRDNDLDQDSYPTPQDCNDNNASIHPGATEICGNGIDEDCSGSDLACPVCTDSDADGYFNVAGCGAAVDCDDANSSIHPGAAEICGNGIDENCNPADDSCSPVEIIIDNADSGFTTTGTWWASGYPSPYGTNSVGVDVNQGSTATWTPAITQAGLYSVYAWWTAGTGRINDAKYTITHANGQTVFVANQKQNGGQWNLLGNFTFNAGTSGFVRINDTSTDPNYIPDQVSDSVCADAIKFVYKSHPADTDQGGCISQSELINYINRWKMNNQDVTMPQMMDGIREWKRAGC